MFRRSVVLLLVTGLIIILILGQGPGAIYGENSTTPDTSTAKPSSTTDSDSSSSTKSPPITSSAPATTITVTQETADSTTPGNTQPPTKTEIESPEQTTSITPSVDSKTPTDTPQNTNIETSTTPESNTSTTVPPSPSVPVPETSPVSPTESANPTSTPQSTNTETAVPLNTPTEITSIPSDTPTPTPTFESPSPRITPIVPSPSPSIVIPEISPTPSPTLIKMVPVVTSFEVQPRSLTEGQQVTITFSGSDPTGANLQEVEVWRTTDFKNWTTEPIYQTAVSGSKHQGQYMDNDLTAGTYWYRVRYSNLNGLSKESTPIQVLVKEASPAANVIGLSKGTKTIKVPADTWVGVPFLNPWHTVKITKMEILVDDPNPTGKIRLGVYDSTPCMLIQDLGEAPVVNGWVTFNDLDVDIKFSVQLVFAFILEHETGIRAIEGTDNSTYSVSYPFGPLLRKEEWTSNDVPPGGSSSRNKYVLRATVVPATTTVTISANAEANGTITPSGAVKVTSGNDQSFDIKPDSGYAIADVLVDGVSAGKVKSYTFNNVVADHIIYVSFTRIKMVSTMDATNVIFNSATLNGQLSHWPTVDLQMIGFEYGKTIDYGKEAPVLQKTGSPIPNDTPAAVFSANVSDLDTGTIYHYRSKAVIGGKTYYGEDKTFATKSATKVVFPDPGLEKIIRESINKPSGDIIQSDLNNITYLYGSEKGIVNLSGLEYCLNLQELYLESNGITDLTPLTKLTKITKLGLSENQQISNLMPLSNLSNLQWLNLSGNQISDLSSLANLVKLQGLDVAGNQIRSVAPLVKLTNLQELYIYFNQINELKGLENMAVLNRLEGRGNRISDLTPLSGLNNLQILNLSDNQISNLAPLANMTGLYMLDLSANQINNILPLLNNASVGTNDIVNITANPLSTDCFFIHIPQLQKKGVSVGYNMPIRIDTFKANNITSNTANFHGLLFAIAGLATDSTVYFEWGKDTNYGNRTGGYRMSGGESFSAEVTGLAPGTTYHYRAVSDEGPGQFFGNDRTFTTIIARPSVSTKEVCDVTDKSAIFYGELISPGSASEVQVYFEYGTTTDFGQTTEAKVISEAGAFSVELTGLEPGTNYHYRALAVGEGTAYGEDISFWTKEGPIESSITTPEETENGDASQQGEVNKTIIITHDFTSNTNVEVNINNIIENKVELKTRDEKVAIEIQENTKLQDAQGKVPQAFTINVLNLPADDSSGQRIIQAYELGPEGAVFDPPITLTLTYDLQILPSGVSENDLMIAGWDGIRWNALESQVDTLSKTVSARIHQFGRYALMAPLAVSQSAQLVYSGLLITPNQIEPNGQVNIQINIVNTGKVDGEATVELKINAEAVDSRKVTVSASQSQTVTFTASPEAPGTYTVEVNGNTGQFTVQAASTAATASSGTPDKSQSVSPLMIWLPAGTIMIIGLIVGLAMYRRRAR